MGSAAVVFPIMCERVAIRGPHEVEFERGEVARPGPHDVVVQARLSGVSAGTEMTAYRGTHPNLSSGKWGYYNSYPIYPGYELVGNVISVGERVEEFSIGDRVVALASHASVAKVPEAYVSKIPDSLTDETATLAVLGTTTMHATRRAAIEYGDNVAIVGLGVVGLLVLQHAKLAGARTVIGVDVDPRKFDIACRLGADECVLRGPDATSTLRRLTGVGPDIVIEASGVAQAVTDSIEYVRDRGRVVVLGYHTQQVSFLPGDEFYHKEVEIRATRATGPQPGLPYQYVRWTCDKSLRYVTQLLAAGKLKADGMITHRFPASEIKQVYEMIDNRSEPFVQILLDWQS